MNTACTGETLIKAIVFIQDPSFMNYIRHLCHHHFLQQKILVPRPYDTYCWKWESEDRFRTRCKFKDFEHIIKSRFPD